ncbi:hypothetical protein FVEG_15641 [Fusarium verticillioides 7600]|uniref:Uncharacterized protein n=1 Tax=Gibberella moniliformis (strain M3125 / FGSC 7600) TaxID=334819 RepID=W7MAC6_GIBM7|nr:hypothetical protein FVEG_15641 [Fusarium verticillioides 7600]EWG44389.1 hypothetical protein FVEG_15641 [Fusarium verticillioides 7600]
MRGSDGGMVTYLDEAISKAVQCEISSKPQGSLSLWVCPRERQTQETRDRRSGTGTAHQRNQANSGIASLEAQAQAPCRRLSMPPPSSLLGSSATLPYPP